MLYRGGDEPLEDIAHFVGHAKPSTSDGHVGCLGRRPAAVAERAAMVLDSHGARRRRGSESGGADGSNRASNAAEPGDTASDGPVR